MAGGTETRGEAEGELRSDLAVSGAAGLSAGGSLGACFDSAAGVRRVGRVSVASDVDHERSRGNDEAAAHTASGSVKVSITASKSAGRRGLAEVPAA